MVQSKDAGQAVHVTRIGYTEEDGMYICMAVVLDYIIHNSGYRVLHALLMMLAIR